MFIMLVPESRHKVSEGAKLEKDQPMLTDHHWRRQELMLVLNNHLLIRHFRTVVIHLRVCSVSHSFVPYVTISPYVVLCYVHLV